MGVIELVASEKPNWDTLYNSVASRKVLDTGHYVFIPNGMYTLDTPVCSLGALLGDCSLVAESLLPSSKIVLEDDTGRTKIYDWQNSSPVIQNKVATLVNSGFFHFHTAMQEEETWNEDEEVYEYTTIGPEMLVLGPNSYGSSVIQENDRDVRRITGATMEHLTGPEETGVARRERMLAWITQQKEIS